MPQNRSPKKKKLKQDNGEDKGPKKYRNTCATFYWKEEKDLKIIQKFIDDFRSIVLLKN